MLQVLPHPWLLHVLMLRRMQASWQGLRLCGSSVSLWLLLLRMAWTSQRSRCALLLLLLLLLLNT
jgi:hypothetical protein